MLGEDFKQARTAWLYPQQPMQTFWRGIVLALLLFLIFEVVIVPTVAACIAHFGFGLQFNEFMGADGLTLQFMQAAIIGMFPSMLLLCLLSWGLVQRGLPGKRGRLPLHWPKLGMGGWLIIGFSFLVIVGLLIYGLFSIAGANDAANQGVIEKTLQQLTADKYCFALAVPGVVLGAPVAEELLFRGYLFSALAPTRLGKTGTVLITSAFWAAAHSGGAPWIAVSGIFVIGLALGIILLRFGSLWVTIVLHALWNGLQTLGLYMVFHQP